jgi:hypothetical protein
MKLLRTFTLSIVLWFAATALFIPLSAQAGLFDPAKEEACKGATAGGGTCNTEEAATTVETTIQKIVDLVSVIIGIVAVVMIMISGFRYITSGGDSNTVSSAKNGLIFAIVGLIIVVMAQIIVRFVIQQTT